MEHFKSYITEQKNTHMTHIEDKVLYGGVKGTREAILALRSLRDMLAGQKEGSVSVKWDGSPAVFAGIDPNDGKFFVAKKGIFNKNPKVYKTEQEVDEDTKGDLATKLKLSFRHLSKLGIKGVVQGDLLFTRGDVSKQTIAGQKYVTFHPNTILYAVPADSAAAKAVQAAHVGIVWHTTYTGNTFESMKASYGVDVSKFKKTKDVWSQDAMLRDLTKMTMSKADTEEVTLHLSNAGKIFNKISGSTIRQLEGNQVLAQHVEQFNNTFVRKGDVIVNTAAHVNHLVKWINDKYQKQADQLKTDKGKNSRYAARDELLSFFSTKNKASLKLMFDLQQHIVLAKLKLINTLNKLQNVDTFVKTRYGFEVTGHEGYVAIDRLGGDAVKIVDRMEFSHNNFSADILKGWDKPGRS
jgi:hypothetical protein